MIIYSDESNSGWGKGATYENNKTIDWYPCIFQF